MYTAHMDKIILKAEDLDGYLTADDKVVIREMDDRYAGAMEIMKVLASSQNEKRVSEAKAQLISHYTEMGQRMQAITGVEDNIQVYPFQTPRWIHGEASRLIAKLRDVRTSRSEFVYYIQRAYELLFNLAFGDPQGHDKNHLIIRTPVTDPVQNFAVHKIPDVDGLIENSVMCVMLRGALLPSMIMSKEIQEYSSTGYVTPFALFKISRDDTRKEADMEYILDLERSFFKLEDLEGKDLIFADPMNATGGSLVTIINYLKSQGVKPKSVQFFNVISALKGTLQVVRAIEGAKVYTLWMDPVLNERAYILPGLGDAGDRLNGTDHGYYQRNIMQLLADYGAQLADLYRSQLVRIEQTVLGGL